MRITFNSALRLAIAAGAALLVASAVAGGQQINLSAAGVALGGNFTALARNFNAVAWNPANLGQSGNSHFTLGLSPQLVAATGPITLKDMHDNQGIVVSDATKKQWVANITSNGGQTVNGDAGIGVGLSLGRLGFEVSTGVFSDGNISPATAELLLFGNAGYTGSPKSYTLTGSSLTASVISTAAVSIGQSIGLVPLSNFSIGVTGKYMVGNGLLAGIETGGTISASPINVSENFPVIMTHFADEFDIMSIVKNGSGRGVGFDVGAAWELAGFRMGAVVKDIVNTFAWDEAELRYRPGTFAFNNTTSTSDIDEQPFANAPTALRQRVSELKIKPTISGGAAFKPLGMIEVAVDARQQLGDGLKLGPKTQLGAGAELRLIPFLPVRAGIQHVTGGNKFSAGAGLELRLINIQVGAQTGTVDGVQSGGLGLTVSFFGH